MASSRSDISMAQNGLLSDGQNIRLGGDCIEQGVRDGQEEEDPIVITGFAARLPQDADTSAGFWRMIYEGRNASTDVPKDRINMDAFYHPNPERPDTASIEKPSPGACNVRRGNFLRGDVAAFDAPFFSIQPIEAESMDPQQRCLLETSYQALENAGIPLESVTGSNASVFIAASNRDYEVMLYRDPEQTPKYMGTGIGTSLLSNRLSWFFDFHGPSVSIDTACSGSLTALSFACETLRKKESNLALVGGVSLILSPEVSMSQLSTLGFLSPDGISYSFDSRANGYAKGEGATVVILKRLSDAIKDNDTARAVVRAISVNQDGRTPGITQPSKAAQTANIKQAYEKNGLDMHQTRYFEAHGTGTAVGDPIEASAINDAFRRPPDNPIHVGSLKANIGHLEASAGIAALIKSVLVLENGILPPNACFKEPNPNIPQDKWNLRFLHEPIVFPGRGVRRISINNFGYGGTNAHAVVDDALNFFRIRNIRAKHNTTEHPKLLDSCNKISNEVHMTNGYSTLQDTVPRQEIDVNGNGTLEGNDEISSAYLLVWSTADEAGIQRMTSAFDDYFRNLPLQYGYHAAKYLQNLSYTLACRRSGLPWKSFCLVRDIAQLREGVATIVTKPVRAYDAPSISFVFTGQGAQWHAMTRGLERYAVFAESLRKSERFLRDLKCGWSLRDELDRKQEHSRVDDPQLAQPLCTALQIGLVDLLNAWGIRPESVVGHSSGEIAAAYCAGALTHASAIQIAFYRGFFVAELQQEAKYQGGMIAVALSETELAPYLKAVCIKTGGTISIGCSNSAQNVTVTGDLPAINALKKEMDSLGVFARRLQVGVAYHSYHMQDIATKYAASLQGIEQPQRLKSQHNAAMFSSVTGSQVSASELGSPQYWMRNLVSKVQFTEATSSMITHLLARQKGTFENNSGRNILVEVGPHSALQRPVKDIIKGVPGAKNFEYDSSGMKDKSPLLMLLGLMGRLCCRGLNIDLAAVNCLDAEGSQAQALTDLPSYVFNHSTSYWVESRMSRAFRFREHGRHELLGGREHDWNPLRPRWRNLIRISEHPWLRDHKFGGSCPLPASAMLSMVIEGARQLTANQELSGYILENVMFLNSFVVPSDTQIMEAQLHFEPTKRTSDDRRARAFDFTLFAWTNESWIEICTGRVSAMTASDKQRLDTDGIEELRKQGLEGLLIENYAKTWESVSNEEYYENLAKMQYTFGPTFRSLSDLRFTEHGEAMANISLDKWSTKVETSPILPHVIHPVDLDAILQSSLEAQSQGGRVNIPILIPTRIDYLWVSHSLLERRHGDILRLLTKTTFKGYRETDFSSGAVDAGGRLRVLIQGFRQTALDNQSHVLRQRLTPRRLCYSVEWKPDPDLLSGDAIKKLCNKAVDTNIIPSPDLVDRQELVSLYYMDTAQKAISKSRLSSMPEHLQKYMHWIYHHLDIKELEFLRRSHPINEMLFGTEEERTMFLTRFAQESPEGKLIVETGKSILPILNGELDALELLFSNDLVSNYYKSPTFSLCITRLLAYVDMLAHKNPSMDILEVGAGTGGATGPILECLSRYTGRSDDNTDIPRYERYTFTDISPAFFEKAKQAFEAYPNIEYSTLNIEKDPTSQGYVEGQYDMVICSAVLHATTNLQETMTNVRKLLKPGGKLILSEPSAPKTARVSFVFGLLQGWWLSAEEERKWCPLIEDDEWHRLLLRTGFNGVYVNLPDQGDPRRHTFSGLVSVAVDSSIETKSMSKTVIFASGKSAAQSTLAEVLREQIQGSNHHVIIENGDHVSKGDFRELFVISLLELETAYFHEIYEEAWTSFKQAVSTAVGFLWINQDHNAQPEIGITKGLGRAIRSELPDVTFVELTLQEGAADAKAAKILQVYAQILTKSQGTVEHEYREDDEGHLSIARVVEDVAVNRKVHNSFNQGQPNTQAFGSDPRALSLSIASPGLLDTFSFEDDDLHSDPLGPTEIEVKTIAVGVNFKDVMIAMGQLAGNKLGFECSGVVTRVGEASKFQPGDKVCCCTTTGAYKTFVRSDSSAVIEIPSGLTFADAAGLPIVFATAYYALVTLANIREGESVLIHSGAGGVGQAAIQIAKRRKARIFTTVSTKEKRLLLRESYQISDDQIFSSRSTDFAKAVKSQTGNGVDVILNSLSGDGQLASWQCIAPLGRFVELGKADIESQKGLPMAPFSRNVSFSSVSLDIVMDKARPLMGRIMTAISNMLSDPKEPITVPHPVTKYSVEHISQAFRYMQSGKHSGKLVIEMDKKASVPVLPSRKPTYMFSENATYVIAGGLGGLGRSVVKWMVDRKARNFILLSRSGIDRNEAAQDLVEEMRPLGVRIEAPRCDITDEQAVSTVLVAIKDSLPPVKGLIQASMVLNDGLFQLMSHASLHSVLRPKTLGTINLSKHLPSDLDFFVILSSIAGVTGSRGQANYAAANTFQDAFASHLIKSSQGTRHCVSLNLGAILSVGFAAENHLAPALRRDGFEGVTKAEFLALLDYVCDPQCPEARDPNKCQIVSGLASAETLPGETFRNVYWTEKPMFRPLVRLSRLADESTNNHKNGATGGASANAGEEDLAQLLSPTTTPAHDAAVEIALRALTARFAQAMAVTNMADLDPHRPVSSFGIDSLTALEMRYWVQKEMKAEVSVIEILGARGLEELAGRVVERCKWREGGGGGGEGGGKAD